jgi:hypothetical protein
MKMNPLVFVFLLLALACGATSTATNQVAKQPLTFTASDFLNNVSPSSTNTAHVYLVTAPDGRKLRLTGDSPPTEEELEEIFAKVGAATTNDSNLSNALPKMTALEFLNAPSSPDNMSKTLTAFRKKYPQYDDVPNDKLIKAIGNKYPVYLDRDPKFKDEYMAATKSAAPAFTFSFEDAQKAADPSKIFSAGGFTPPSPNDIISDSSAPPSLKPTSHVDWELVACVTLALLIITLSVLICLSLIRYVRRTMVSASKLIILSGAVAFILCGLFPPWLYISNEGHTRSTGYGFILLPPANTDNRAYGTKLDIARLSVEWLCIAVATGTVWMLVSKPEKGKGSKGN